MSKNDWLQILLKVLLYALGLIAAGYGVAAVTSCSVSHGTYSKGRAVIVTTDTTVIDHSGAIQFPKQ